MSDLRCFRSLGGGYGTDGARVYSGAELVPCRQLERFRVLGSGFAVDDQHVYWQSEVIEGLSPTRVRFAGDNYLVHDDRDVYHWSTRLPNTHGPSFEVLDRWFARDAHRVYYWGKPLANADPATFAVEKGSRPAATDAAARYVLSTGNMIRVPHVADQSSRTHRRSIAHTSASGRPVRSARRSCAYRQYV